MAFSDEMKAEVMRLVDDLAVKSVDKGGFWRSKPLGTVKMKAIPGADSRKLLGELRAIADQFDRFVGARMCAEICRLIPEPVMVLTHEVETEYDDVGSCDFYTSITLLVRREGEWDVLDDHWEESHPGLREEIEQAVHDWANVVHAALISRSDKVVFEPINDEGEVTQAYDADAETASAGEDA